MPNHPLFEQLAFAAEVHARREHRIPNLTIEDVEAILVAERARGQVENLQALMQCYGAWLGQQIVSLGGEWRGLEEPVPPRVYFRGRYYSPLDEIQRRLLPQGQVGDSLAELLQRMQNTDSHESSAATAQQRNLLGWRELAKRPEFTNRSMPLLSIVEATLQLDPWVRAEGIQGKRVLCLAAGGGTHAALHAMAGANVTVVDFVEELLAIDREFAQRHRLPIDTCCTTMEDLSSLEDRSFDVVVQPVSSCYVSDLRRVYSEVARVIKPAGMYTVQHKSPVSLQMQNRGGAVGYELVSPAAMANDVPTEFAVAEFPAAQMLRRDRSGGDESEHAVSSGNREAGCVEFAHSLESLVGELCRSGFVLEDLVEPLRADWWAPLDSAAHRANFVAPYLKVKARRSEARGSP
ncbi:class I SAM-dependent methyltransferase [Aureliella helgolandensis]|uniref:Bifunctional 3-demethylubiquinone-9 3-methyltransferase/ 2-octaprenyl-6-hydroxy phenol methylase n=1 Tax=Aureliella helgolandensis TaxID=2527968 RepID=A0A518G6T1_9BACT|nr:class I SAM-dependent methyltransferase [Aureliella helgolandensis]QDV24297.1 bifunctional 3-demethylubiquinone-9 3-methyltransferase/ 2-octaprenyl-6-hydroxy phenol methylase [Aureliella helgolandensis]